jgi:hypothetical protein
MQARHSRKAFKLPDCAVLAPQTDDPGDRKANAPVGSATLLLQCCLLRLGQLH